MCEVGWYCRGRAARELRQCVDVTPIRCRDLARQKDAPTRIAESGERASPARELDDIAPSRSMVGVGRSLCALASLPGRC